MCITVSSSEHIYKESAPIFLEILNDNPNNDVRIAVRSKTIQNLIVHQAADALGFICFTSNTDERATLDVMSIFAKLFSGRHPTAPKAADSLKAACLNSWTLLVTTIEKRVVHDTLIPEQDSEIEILLI